MVIASSGPLKFSILRNEMNYSGKISINTIQYNYFKNSLNTKFNIGNKFYNFQFFPLITENNINNKMPTLISGTTYYYLFTSISGQNTITFKNNITCEILLVGGGGAGGGGGSFASSIARSGGGGGGGCVYYDTQVILSGNTIYSIIVGTGGHYYWYEEDLTPSTPSQIITGNITLMSADGGGYATTYSDKFTGGMSSAKIAKNGIIISSLIYNCDNDNYPTIVEAINSNFYAVEGGAGAGGKPYYNSPLYYAGSPFSCSITGSTRYYGGGGGGFEYCGPNSSLVRIKYLEYNTNVINYGDGGDSGCRPYNIKGDAGANGCVIIKFTL